jgi:hypothetical protein
MSQFPFLDHIPIDTKRNRFTVANELDLWQREHHPDIELEVSIAIKNKTWPVEEPQPVPEIPTESMSEQEIVNIMSQAPEHQEKV